MVFTPPSWVPQLPFDPPDSVPIHEFLSNERYGRVPFDKSRNPYTCGLTGKTYTHHEMVSRHDLLARALSKRLGWRPNEDTPWDKVVAVFSFNSIDYIMSHLAVHRLNGIVTPANAVYSAPELEFQLRTAGAKALFTCAPLLETALKAAKACGISEDRVFLLDLPDGASNGKPSPPQQKLPFRTADELIAEGRAQPELEPLIWAKGQGDRQVAYLCFSSGTSGLPKAVMISHVNVIANMMQARWHEDPSRQASGVATENVIGLLPMSHIYGLVVVALTGAYRGDGIITLPRFELKTLLGCIQHYKISLLYLVPPILINLLRSPETVARYDVTSARHIFTGAAPLGAETHEELERRFPHLRVGQGYGMTETCTLVISTPKDDVCVGTSGSLIPATRAKLLGEAGEEIHEHGVRGELLIQSPSVALGYLNNQKATAEAFVWDADGRWMRTGDVAVVSKSPATGAEHFAIVDRMKELIKVKGHQVAPAELEAHLLTHADVADCTVISVPDERAGEAPKAFVVKSREAAGSGRSDDEVARAICKHVEEHKSSYKWLRGGVEFIEAIPKSPSGKILRRVLKDKEKDARRARGAKI